VKTFKTTLLIRSENTMLVNGWSKSTTTSARLCSR